MTVLVWDQVGERQYEAGVDRGVLFPTASDGTYDDGVAWNGLTTVTESPSGAESNPQYADNIKYLNLVSYEEFGATIEAFTYPEEFGRCDGSVSPELGVALGQQGRRHFGLCYRTRVGNDVDGSDWGYKLHLIYGALASPSEKAYGTINDSPEAITFSWDITTTPVEVTGYQPTAILTVDSTTADADGLADLESILYGTSGTDPRLPLPTEVIALFAGSTTDVDLGVPARQPTYNAGTHVVTLPAVTGIQWQINGVNKTPGAQPALTVGQVAVVTAAPLPGYTVSGDDDWAFDY